MNKKHPPHRFCTVGIVQLFPRASTQFSPQTSSQWCSVCPPYGVDSMNCPNLTRGGPSKGVGQGRCRGVLYKLIKNNRDINLILQLILFSTYHSPAVENGCQNGIQYYFAMVVGSNESRTPKNGGKLLAIKIDMAMQQYNAERIAQWSTSRASLKATGCCHRSSACAVSP